MATTEFDKDTYDPGDTVTLTVTYDVGVTATQPGQTWQRTSADTGEAVFTATATESGTVEVTLPDSTSVSAAYTVTVPPPPAALKVIGMSAPAGLWAQRLAEVGPKGINARRIFSSLSARGDAQSNLIDAALNAGMLPVVSYKAPSAAGAASGQYDAMMEAVGEFLASKGQPITATYWHEPHGDMTPAEFRNASQRFVDRVQSENVKVGPILNGWLLDRRLSDFESYTNTALLNAWDWFGMDTYHSGSPASPGDTWPGHRVPLLEDFLASKGHEDMPVGIGEYNGFSAEAVAQAGEAFLSMEQLWFACVWNSTGGTFEPLTGARLAAFKATKADPRAQQ